jgi:glucose/arabinose dehydrogenase
MIVRFCVRCVVACNLIFFIVGCGAAAKLSVIEGTGANPVLPPPNGSLIPLVHVVDAKGWSPDEAACAAVVAFARDLDHPRWLHVLPNGDVLVAETNAPPRPDDAKGIKGWFLASRPECHTMC